MTITACPDCGGSGSYLEVCSAAELCLREGGRTGTRSGASVEAASQNSGELGKRSIGTGARTRRLNSLDASWTTADLHLP